MQPPVREIDNIVVNQNISYYDKTSKEFEDTGKYIRGILIYMM